MFVVHVHSLIKPSLIMMFFAFVIIRTYKKENRLVQMFLKKYHTRNNCRPRSISLNTNLKHIFSVWYDKSRYYTLSNVSASAIFFAKYFDNNKCICVQCTFVHKMFPLNDFKFQYTTKIECLPEICIANDMKSTRMIM